MNVKVTKDNVSILNKDELKVHVGEYKVNLINFDFSEEYTSAPLIFSTSLNVAGAQDLKSVDNSVKVSSPGNSSKPLDTTMFASANPLSL